MSWGADAGVKFDLVTYVSDALSRVEAGGVTSPSGSWLVGIFGRAASLLEKEVSLLVAGLLSSAGLRYPEDLTDAVPGNPPYAKLTLGQLAAVIRKAAHRQPTAVSERIPCGRTSRFVEQILKVNATWVATKHGEEIDSQVLVSRMRTMLTLAKLLNEGRPADTTPNKPFSRRNPRIRSGLAAERRR
jgi:hypothetical protein